MSMIWVTQRDRDGGEQAALTKQRVSLGGVYVWGVNLTVTKHPEYCVSKDTSERVNGHCDKTSWQEASRFFCIKTLGFLREFRNKKNRQNSLEMLSPMHYLCHVLKISRLAPPHKNRASRGFEFSTSRAKHSEKLLASLTNRDHVTGLVQSDMWLRWMVEIWPPHDQQNLRQISLGLVLKQSQPICPSFTK